MSGNSTVGEYEMAERQPLPKPYILYMYLKNRERVEQTYNIFLIQFCNFESQLALYYMLATANNAHFLITDYTENPSTHT